MQATCVTHIGICVRDMEKSLAFYRDALGVKVLGDKFTNPTDGGRPYDYKHRRMTRRWVSLSYGEGTVPQRFAYLVKFRCCDTIGPLKATGQILPNIL